MKGMSIKTGQMSPLDLNLNLLAIAIIKFRTTFEEASTQILS